MEDQELRLPHQGEFLLVPETVGSPGHLKPLGGKPLEDLCHLLP
jgi:hypothetical protein